jgi:putative hemolysin
VDETRQRLRDSPHAILPLCDGGLDRVVGVVRASKAMAQVLERGTLELEDLKEPALFVPEAMTLMRLLEEFKRSHLSIALVVDEFGGVEGLVSLADVVGSIVGDMPAEPGEEPSVVRREDGSLLLDGSLDLDTVFREMDADSLLTAEERQHYHTLGGYAMLSLGRVPRTGDTFDRHGYRFEVVDMDGNRVDRVLVSRRQNGNGDLPRAVD